MFPIPRRHGWRSWLTFGLLAAATGTAGFVLAETAVEFRRKIGLSEGAIGPVFTAVTTSLPEALLLAPYLGAVVIVP